MILCRIRAVNGRCLHTTGEDFVPGMESRIARLPHFTHIMATWVRECGSGPFQNLARKAGLFRKIPNHGLERA
jgi:hypothetical protein